MNKENAGAERAEDTNKERARSASPDVEKFTPGPWRVITSLNEDWAGVQMGRDGGFSLQCPNAEANARLIASAPDLLDALRDLVSSHEGYQLGVGPCICAAHETARAVIAKATRGRS